MAQLKPSPAPTVLGVSGDRSRVDSSHLDKHKSGRMLRAPRKEDTGIMSTTRACLARVETVIPNRGTVGVRRADTERLSCNHRNQRATAATIRAWAKSQRTRSEE